MVNNRLLLATRAAALGMDAFERGPPMIAKICNIRPNTTQRRSVEKVPINDCQASVTLILLVFHRLDLAS